MKIPHFKVIILYFFLLMSLLLFYTLIDIHYPINSDSISTLIISKDIINGNVLLHGWELSAQSFYLTEILPYALLFGTTGWHLSFYYFLPAFMWSIVILLTASLSGKNISWGWPLLTLLAVPSSWAAPLILSPCYHVGGYIVMLLFWVAIDKNPNIIQFNFSLKSAFTWSIISFFTALLMASDDLIKYCLTFPLIIACIVKTTTSNKLTHPGLALSMLCALGLEHAIKSALVHNGAFHVPGLWSSSFASKDRVIYNSSVLLFGALDFFDANLLGKPISIIGSGRQIFHIFLLIISIFLFSKSVRHYRHWNLFELTASLSLCIMVFAFLFSEITIDEKSFRYLVFPFLLLIITSIRTTNINFYSKSLLIFSGLISIFLSYPKIDTLDYQKTNNNYLVNRYLKSKNLSKGFGLYWIASSNSIPNIIRIAPVEFSKSGIKADHILTKSIWYKDGGNFVLCNTTEETLQLEKTFGPAQVTKIGNVFVTIWDHNITVPDE